ncbi:MAG: hypothetical protein HY566_00745 [Candidatus Kerfeldbacteria bacterium]|nr:hypothetical protein [Candidatus Kerfeldbacteria bacterium]
MNDGDDASADKDVIDEILLLGAGKLRQDTPQLEEAPKELCSRELAGESERASVDNPNPRRIIPQNRFGRIRELPHAATTEKLLNAHVAEINRIGQGGVLRQHWPALFYALQRSIVFLRNQADREKLFGNRFHTIAPLFGRKETK